MNLTPRQLQEEYSKISDELYEMCQEMATIAEKKGTAWLELRNECKTNAECDQRWAASELGKRENYLKWYIKGLQSKRGAMKQELQANSGNPW